MKVSIDGTQHSVNIDLGIARGVKKAVVSPWTGAKYVGRKIGAGGRKVGGIFRKSPKPDAPVEVVVVTATPAAA